MSAVAPQSETAGAVGVIIGASGKEVCRAFRNTGRCRFEKECKFEHSTGDRITPPARDYTPKGDCHNWAKEQKCKFGDRCRFVHGPEDKRTTYRPERKEAPAAAGTGEKSGEICRNFQNRGRCRFGDRCRHLHVASEKAPARESKQGSEEKKDGDAAGRLRRPRRRGARGARGAGAGAGAQNGAGAGAGAAPARAPRAPAPKRERAEAKVLREEDKFDADGVELCRNFRNTGRCRFGDSCTYSHVPGPAIGHPAQRPVGGECYNWKEKGACEFGAECRFKHGEADQRTEVPRRRPARAQNAVA